MNRYAPLGAATWDAFVNLAEKHNGVWGGCSCTFSYERSKGKNHCVMRRAVRPSKRLDV